MDGFDIEARLEFDEDERPDDHGFDPNDPNYGEENRRICKSWKQDEWCYVGVVLSVSKHGITLNDSAASLWGVDMNFPDGNNSHLTEVANELLDEALDVAKAKLASLCTA